MIDSEMSARDLKGLHVLAVVPDNDRRMRALADRGRDLLGWTIETVRTDLSDFRERMDGEADARGVAEIDAFIGQCELNSGVAAGRILLTGARDIGRGFSRPNIRLPENVVARNSIADVAVPFRIVRRLFAFARDTLRSKKIDLLVAESWGAPLPLVFRLAAQQMGIRCVVCRPSQIWNGRHFWSVDLVGLNVAARAKAEAKRLANAPVSTQAQNYVSAFRAGLSDAEDMADAPLSSHRSGPFVRFETEALQDMRYIYMALHAEPSVELDLGAPFWATQYYTSGLLTSGLPAGYRLLVQDHSKNVEYRPRDYYANLARLPGVDLVDPAENRKKYIAHAELVVTENGRAGWEGLLLERPVLTLSDNFFQGTGLAHRLRQPEHLSRTVINLLAPSLQRDSRDRERSLGWMIDAEWETTASESDATPFDLLASILHQDGWRASELRMEVAS